MSEEHTPPTEEQGALEPPRKGPPTALATATPGPSPESKGQFASWRGVSAALEPFLSRALDVVDEVADTIARALRLRPE